VALWRAWVGIKVTIGPKGRSVVSHDRRVYTDEEFGLILRKATELASRADPRAPSSAGLTLTEMKAAAAQVGLDPVLIDRAARLLAARATASRLERLIGGPVRHDHEVRFQIKLNEKRAGRLLSAVRISAGQSGSYEGHSSSMGMAWHDGGEMEALSVTARPEENGTSVSVVLDRRGTLVAVAGVSGMAMFFSVLFAVYALYPEAPALGYGGFVAGIGAALAAARSYWASSTRKVRERIGVVIDAIGQTLAEPDAQPSGLGTVLRLEMTVDFEASDLEARVRASFGRQRVMQTLGAELTAILPGSVVVELPFREQLVQQHGFIHAGIISVIADSACGYSAYTLMPPEAAVLTVEFKINLMAPARGERFIATARVVRSGRTLSTCAADVIAVERGEERVVATMLATVMAVSDRPGLTG
jgi:uncharacterized protein (TIGR00369 family)